MEVCAKHGTDRKLGLNQEEAESRLQRDGPNSLTPPKEKPWYILFLREISSGFALLLWFAGIASFISFGFDHNPQDVSIMCELYYHRL